MDNLSVVKTYGTRAEAETAKSLLDSQKIYAYVAADDAGAMEQALQFSIGVRLMVKKKDLVKAKKLLSVD